MDNGFDFFGFSFESVIGGFIAIMIFAGVFNFVKSIFVTIYNKFFWSEDKYYHSKEKKTFTDSFLENSKKENIEELQYEIDELDQEEKVEDLKEHLSNQEFIHNEALNYMEWTGYYITNYKDKKKLENGVDGIVFRYLKTNEEKTNAKVKFKNSAKKVFTAEELNRFVQDKLDREKYIIDLKTKLLN